MARRLGGIVLVGVVAWSLLGCSHKSPDADDSQPQSAMPWAANANEVTRFTDEEPFGPVATVTQSVRVLKAPGGADVVATLPAGTEIVKLASRGSDDLICFDEPKPGARHLMGWLSQASIRDQAPPPAPGPGPDAQDAGPPDPPDPPSPPSPHGGHHHGKKKGKQRPPQ